MRKILKKIMRKILKNIMRKTLKNMLRIELGKGSEKKPYFLWSFAKPGGGQRG